VSQVALAEEFKISRTPLREALRMLQEEGLIVAEHNRGMRVADLNIDRCRSWRTAECCSIDES
jgi:DNA-binding GntR family transcriptional regulator